MTVLLRAALVIGVLSYFAMLRTGADPAAEARKLAGAVPSAQAVVPAALEAVPPETRVVSPLKHCPHLLEGQTLCLWRQGSTRAASRWDPARFTCVFAIQAAWRWLACYEVWHDTGEWPLPEAK